MTVKKLLPYLLPIPIFIVLAILITSGVIPSHKHFLAQATPSTGGTTYFVDAAEGNDSNDGLSASTAWRTVAKVNTTVLQPGDTVLFKTDGIYPGGIFIRQSGTSNAPITFSSYGNGATPIISGFTTLSGWTQDGGGVWEASCANCATTATVVTLNGTPEAMGRYPNADAANGGYLTYSSHTAQNSITDTTLPDSTNWTGAEAVVRTNHWTVDRRKITAQAGGVLSLASNLTYVPINGYGYFIQNDPRTLDEAGEWYYNPTTKVIQMYFGNIDPTTSVVKVSHADNLLAMNGVNNIAINGLSFEGANSKSISITNGQNIVLTNTVINDSGQYALFASGSSDLTIKNNTVTNSLNSGIVLSSTPSDTVDIENNTITNTGIIPGMSLGGGNTAMFLTASNLIVQDNTIRNSGYSGIYFFGNNVLIKNNIIDNFNTVKDDGGGIYTFNGYGSLSGSYNQKIIGNIVTDGSADSLHGTPDTATPVTVGIYLDNNTNNVDVAGNTVANNEGVGIFLHVNNHINVENNTVFNNSAQLWIATTATTDSPNGNNIITGNIFGTSNSTQLLLDLGLNSNKIPGAAFGTFNNNYYIHPAGSSFIRTIISPGTPSTTLNFSTWQTTYGQDTATQEILDSNPLFQYNATASPSTVSLNGAFKDVFGIISNGSITLPPFSGTILTNTPVPSVAPYVGPTTTTVVQQVPGPQPMVTVPSPTTTTAPPPVVVPTPTIGGTWTFSPTTTGIVVQTTAPTSHPIAKNLTLSVANTHKNYTITQVDYVLDGTLIHTSKTFPDNWVLDTTTLKDGTYTLVTTLYYADKRTDVSVQTVTIDNTPNLWQQIVQFVHKIF